MENKINLMKKLRSSRLAHIYTYLSYELKHSTSRLCGFNDRISPAFCLHGINLKDPELSLLTYELKGIRATSVTIEKGEARTSFFFRSAPRTSGASILIVSVYS